MCIACNVIEQTDSVTSFIVPLVNNLFEMHTFQVIESFLIQASLVGFLL